MGNINANDIKYEDTTAYFAANPAENGMVVFETDGLYRQKRALATGAGKTWTPDNTAITPNGSEQIVLYDAQGRVISGRAISQGDIPDLSATYALFKMGDPAGINYRFMVENNTLKIKQYNVDAQTGAPEITLMGGD